ncbi:hypothetical protein C7B77_20290 [Chamaesiphon polymorphus CCALA 037]|uniref:Uncharacterized protein n=2 Tax=Chamaesiphon TaxID=217161 RepID=A0A2T1G5Z8_9CYAN|nr:hypothetical protein C7B77_20290 [Chamaesiphon polymorphus CCALA 037]
MYGSYVGWVAAHRLGGSLPVVCDKTEQSETQQHQFTHYPLPKIEPIVIDAREPIDRAIY